MLADVERGEPEADGGYERSCGRQSAVGYKQRDILHVAQSQYHDIGVARDLDYAVCWIERRQGQPGFGGTPVPPGMTTPALHFATLEALADAVDAAFAG